MMGLKRKKHVVWIVSAGVLFSFLALSVALFDVVDRRPYTQMDYYKKMIAQIEHIQINQDSLCGKYLKCGWSVENITPPYPLSMAGYSFRGLSNGVHDSIYARVLVFDNGIRKIAIVSVDLLIFPPEVKYILDTLLKNKPVESSSILYTATHTHSASGGWAKRIAGRATAGKFNPQYVEMIAHKITKALYNAVTDMSDAKIGYAQYDASRYVKNRLGYADSRVDPWLRVIKIEKQNGSKALMLTFSAHPNCLSPQFMKIAGDYPTALSDILKKTTDYEFISFSAGAVGSHAPSDFASNVQKMGAGLAEIVTKNSHNIRMQETTTLYSIKLPLWLREPHLRLHKHVRIRPWVFDFIIGRDTPTIDMFRIGNIVIIGTPCDLSGELMSDFEHTCKQKNIHLIATSFNGGYIGYINSDKHYDEYRSETMEMNWFGPYNQAYFTEIINCMLNKF
ncbi:MAG: neutral/alkaline non-lysosomal ceramidase N-terminal domain-containing protein [Cytophagaceae bacterium]|nr:neutral/alkaline non-lysosomal ceramidase N-terminal domain-containing protein [Cytophagaceae bacterium]MDW8457076.1 neutral/alkaline non-lysosomal ceramidase N-terminal domain-containing protein [Cytophagaceae bacterium]